MMNYEYQVGGSLPVDAPSYVKREADEDLYQELKMGQLCYVLNARQTGKSSLRVKTMQRLQDSGIICAFIDLTEIGKDNVTPETWYAGVVQCLVSSCQLSKIFEWRPWWREHRDLLSPVQRLNLFIEEILLEIIEQKIVIFIDEIDSVLRLDFSLDDFFAFIRACYQKRVDLPKYKKLSFALLGVATPNTLIQDKTRTPFNIGKAIELNGFQLREVEPLIKGLKDYVKNPQALMTEILVWTQGQPFLTQKLCQLVVNCHNNSGDTPFFNQLFLTDDYSQWLNKIVQTHIIENWEFQDDPEHLRTIRDRIIRNEQKAGQLLGLYQKILHQEKYILDGSSQQMELRLSGLVVQKYNTLKVSNLIYIQVFNLNWVNQELGKLRPYSEAITAWIESKERDKSRLVQGEALQEAIYWAEGKNLSDQDYRFLSDSKELEYKNREINIIADNQYKVRKRLRQIRVTLIVAILAAISAFLFGLQAKEHHKEAVRSEITTLSLLTQTQLALDTSKENLVTLISSIKASKQLLKNSKLLDSKVRTDLEKQIETNLRHTVYDVLERNRLPHENIVNAVSFSPDNKLIASASFDGVVKLWFPNGKLYKTLIEHRANVNDVVFSQDSKLIATVSNDKTIKIFNQEGRLIRTLESMENSLSISFSPDSQTIAITSDHHSVKILDIKGKLIKLLEADDVASSSTSNQSDQYKFLSVSFSPNGQLIAAASTDSTVKIWNRNSGRLLHILKGHKDWVRHLSFSPNGKFIVSSGGGSDKTIKLWSVSNSQLLKTINDAHDDAIESVAFSPNGKLIATASADQTLKIWDINSILSIPSILFELPEHKNILLKTIKGHNSGLHDLSFSPDSQFIASAGNDNNVKLWRIDNILYKSLKASKEIIWDVRFSPDGKIIATVGADKTVKLWSLSGKLLKSLTGHKDWIWRVNFSSDSQFIASASEDHTVKVWKLNDGSLQFELKHKDWVNDVNFSPDNQMIASTSYDNKVNLWRFTNRQLLRTFPEKTSSIWGLKLNFSPNGKIIAFSDKDNRIQLWEISSGKRLRNLKGHKGTIYRISFSPNGQIIASASDDGTVKLWKTSDGKLIKDLKEHNNAVWDANFSPDSKLIATASDDRTVKLWTSEGQLLRTLEAHDGKVHSVSFSPDSKILVSADSYGIVKFWSLNYLDKKALSLNELIKRGCILLHDYLQNNLDVNNEERHLCDGF